MTIGLAMIVRNEAERIDACLASAIQYINSWTICDTGSVDGTPQHVRDALRGIPGRLYHHEWQNFGHNRSRLYAKAKDTTDWLLCLDADMTVEIDDDFEPDPAVDAYMIEMGEPGGFSWRLPLLLNGHLAWKCVGVVHAYTDLKDRSYVGVPTDKVRLKREDSWTLAKGKLQVEQLEDLLAQDSENARTVFYLAQSYREIDDHVAALAMYNRRVTMGGNPEEVFYSAYRGALLLPNWALRAQALAAAWEMRPTRLEPLHDLVQGFNQLGMHRIAYVLCNVASTPPTDNSFVHRDVWDWGMKFERSVAAYWVGNKAECMMLSDELLANANLPERVREQVTINRGFCE